MKAQRNVWAETLIAVASTDSSVVVVDGDLANSTKADLFADAYPGRFIEAGIAEQNMVGVAFGLATNGFRPWLSSFSVFLNYRALDQIRMLISQTLVPVRIAGAYSGLLNGRSGKTHQDIADLAIMRSMPNMVVLAPSDEVETRAMVEWASTVDGPIYMRLSREGIPPIFDASYRFRPGQPIVLNKAGGPIVVSTGVQTARTIEALRLLEQQGIQLGHIHLPMLKPLDERALLEAISEAHLVFTVEEHSIIGGLGSLITELTAEQHPVQVHRIGLADGWSESGPDEFLLDKYGLSAERVAEQIQARLSAQQRGEA